MNDLKDMQRFMDMIRIFVVSNPNKIQNYNFIYSLLINFENKEMGVSIIDLQDYCISRYSEYNNINTMQYNSFLWFLNGKTNGNEVKLYVPLDSNHIKKGTDIIFDFMSSINMKHQSKISKSIRNDDLVIRVENLSDAKKIIDFVSNNEYLKEGLLQVNPFVPNYNGIGMTMDSNKSYNSEVSKLLFSFVKYLEKNNSLNLFTVSEFNKYINSNINNINDIELKDIYKLISMVTDGMHNNNGYLEFFQDRLLDKYEGYKRVTDPNYYFEKVIISTYSKYGYDQCREAILKCLQGNYNYFTNKYNDRTLLEKNVLNSDIRKIILSNIDLNECVLSNVDEIINKVIDTINIETKVHANQM